MASIWDELKRRKVVKVVFAYGIVAWLLIQIIVSIEGPLNLPDWTDTLVIVLLAVGFILAVFLAWAYELTPGGVKRTRDVPLSKKVDRVSGRKLDFAIIALLVVAFIFVFFDSYVRDGSPTSAGAPDNQTGIDSALPAGPQPVIQKTVLANSVAVLPLANLSPDPDNDFFAAGVHESILNQLAKIEDINVIARTSVLRYVGGDKTITEIAAELNVQAVMEGSVRYANDRVLVTAQLIDPQTNAHLWSDEYDRPLDDIFAIQTDIAIRISRALAAELTVNERQSIENVPTDSANAYQLFLRGRYNWNIGRSVDIARSVEYYEEALQLDPDFALAHAGLANAYTFLVGMGELSPLEYWPLAMRAATRALELNPNLSEAFTARGLIRHFFDWDFEAGDRDFLQAIAQSPNSAIAHQLYGKNLPNSLQFEKAVTEVQRALELDPYSVSANKDLGEVFYYSRRFDDAIAQFEKTLSLEPGYPSAYFYLVFCYEALGRRDDAIDNYLALMNPGATPAPNHLTNELYRTSGWVAFWREKAADLTQKAEQSFVEPMRLVEYYLRAGNKDEALTWLEKAFEIRSAWIATMHIDPSLDSIRTDPRFTDILRRAGLEKWVTPN